MLPAHQLLQALSFNISLITEEAFSRGWLLSTRRGKAILSAHVGEGLLGMSRVYASPPLQLDAPLYVWEPGDKAPSFGWLSYAARKRWQVAPVPTTVYYATPSTADLFGGAACSKTTILQAAHELHMCELFIRHRLSRREAGVEWLRGDIFAGGSSRCARIPDAVVVCSCGCRTIQKAIEFAGAYPSTRIRTFHLFCDENAIPYEIW